MRPETEDAVADHGPGLHTVKRVAALVPLATAE
jgi:hypothetical protein